MSEDTLLDELRSAFEARSAGIEDRPELLDDLLSRAPQQSPRRIARPLLAAAASIAVIAAAVVVQRDFLSSGGNAAPASSTLVGTSTQQKFPPSGLPSYFVADQIRSVKPGRPRRRSWTRVTMKVAYRLPVALRYAQLSPDGTRVYGIYAGRTAQSRISTESGMRVVYYDLSTDGWWTSRERSGSRPSPCPRDGHSLAYAQLQHTPKGDITRIEVRNLSSGKRTALEVPNGNGTLAMALSPDGGTLAVHADPHAEHAVRHRRQSEHARTRHHRSDATRELQERRLRLPGLELVRVLRARRVRRTDEGQSADDDGGRPGPDDAAAECDGHQPAARWCARDDGRSGRDGEPRRSLRAGGRPSRQRTGSDARQQLTAAGRRADQHAPEDDVLRGYDAVTVGSSVRRQARALAEQQAAHVLVPR